MKNVTWEEIEGSNDQLTNFTETAELSVNDEELVTGGIWPAVVAVVAISGFFYTIGADLARRDNARDGCGC